MATIQIKYSKDDIEKLIHADLVKRSLITEESPAPIVVVEYETDFQGESNFKFFEVTLQ